MAISKTQIVLMVSALVLYVIHLILMGFAVKGNSSAFPTPLGDVASTFPININPDKSVFAIWFVVFLYQLIWQIYSVATIFRRGDEANILSGKVFLCFICYIISMTVWLFLWSHRNLVGAMVTVAISALFLDVALSYSFSDLRDYLDVHPVVHKNKLDVWSQRLLVQNGIMLNASWVALAAIFAFATFLSHSLDVATSTASLVALILLGCFEIIWFCVENCILAKYIEYTFTNYISLLVGLTGILKTLNKGSNDEASLKDLTLALIGITCFFFVIRLGLMFLRWLRTKEEKNNEEKGILMADKRRV